MDLTNDHREDSPILFEAHSNPISERDHFQSTPVEIVAEKDLSRAELESFNQSCEVFTGDHSDEEFEGIMASLSDEVMSGSQPLPQEQGMISQLPNHLLENIFSCLPGYEMMVSCPLVCSTWNQLIRHEQFMPWKKLYLRIRNNDKDAYNFVKNLLESDTMDGSQKSEPELEKTFVITKVIRLMGVWKLSSLTIKEVNLMSQCLKRHPLHNLAHQALMKRIIPNIEQDEQNPSVTCWMLASTIFLFSSDIFHLQNLMKILLKVHHFPVVMDFYYVAAVYTWVLYRERKLSQELHYRIYCSIARVENSSVSLTLTENAFANYRPYNLTHEQAKVASHQFQAGDIVRVVAYAGTGKTSTLVACARANPHLRFLYTSFNKSVVDQAKTVFNFPNVDCRTMHSLAYCGMNMSRYKEKRCRGSFRAYYVREKLNLPDEDSQMAMLIIRTIQAFLASSDSGLKLSHTPFKQRTKSSNNHWTWEEIGPERKEVILKYSKVFWQKTSDLSNTEWKMNDDCYLKQWQLTLPELHSYNVILLDEAQDCTPCMRDILHRQQKHCALVYVGDSHQQIYGFRLARDALVAILPTHTYYLTQSFRFGTEIAQVADCILRAFKFNDFSRRSNNQDQRSVVADKTLLGVGQPGSISGDEGSQQVAILCRTNLGVIKKVLSSLRTHPNRSVSVVGGATKLGLVLISDLYALSKPPQERMRLNLNIKTPDMRRYRSLKEVNEEATATDDVMMLAKIDIVNAIGDGIPEAIRILRGLPDSLDGTDIVISTIHKAKGLEFDTVVLFDDFAKGLVEMFVSGKELSKYQREEANLLYVAATRAKQFLVMSPTLCKLLDFCKVHFKKPTLTAELFENSLADTQADRPTSHAKMFCIRCKAMLNPSVVVTLVQPKINQMQDEGPTCPKCGSSSTPGWGSLLGDPIDILPTQNDFQHPTVEVVIVDDHVFVIDDGDDDNIAVDDDDIIVID